MKKSQYSQLARQLLKIVHCSTTEYNRYCLKLLYMGNSYDYFIKVSSICNCVINYTVKRPNTKANRERYNELVKGWWNWVYSSNCDNSSTNPILDITFLRDDIIGSRLVLAAGVSSTSIELQPCHTKNITVKAGTNIFLPVYHVNTVNAHPYGDGKTCGSISRCIQAARNDLGNLYQKWAKIRINGGKAKDITNNLNNHYFESNRFTLTVKGKNSLNREQGFSLGKGKYQGVGFGIYLLLTNFQTGNYEIDFGGKATNYRTRAVYHLSVK